MKAIIFDSKGNDSAYRYLVDRVNDINNQLNKQLYQDYIEHPDLTAGILEAENQDFLIENCNFIRLSPDDIINKTIDIDVEIWLNTYPWIYPTQYRFFAPDNLATTKLEQLTYYFLTKKYYELDPILQNRVDGDGYHLYVNYFNPGHREYLESQGILIEINPDYQGE